MLRFSCKSKRGKKKRGFGGGKKLNRKKKERRVEKRVEQEISSISRDARNYVVGYEARERKRGRRMQKSRRTMIKRIHKGGGQKIIKKKKRGEGGAQTRVFSEEEYPGEIRTKNVEIRLGKIKKKELPNVEDFGKGKNLKATKLKRIGRRKRSPSGKERNKQVEKKPLGKKKKTSTRKRGHGDKA